MQPLFTMGLAGEPIDWELVSQSGKGLPVAAGGSLQITFYILLTRRTY